MYIPRKCNYTNRIIKSSDRGCVTVNVGHVDPSTGLYTGEFTAFSFSGALRQKGEADYALTQLIKNVPGINA